MRSHLCASLVSWLVSGARSDRKCVHWTRGTCDHSQSSWAGRRRSGGWRFATLRLSLEQRGEFIGSWRRTLGSLCVPLVRLDRRLDRGTETMLVAWSCRGQGIGGGARPSASIILPRGDLNSVALGIHLSSAPRYSPLLACTRVYSRGTLAGKSARQISRYHFTESPRSSVQRAVGRADPCPTGHSGSTGSPLARRTRHGAGGGGEVRYARGDTRTTLVPKLCTFWRWLAGEERLADELFQGDGRSAAVRSVSRWGCSGGWRSWTMRRRGACPRREGSLARSRGWVGGSQRNGEPRRTGAEPRAVTLAPLISCTSAIFALAFRPRMGVANRDHPFVHPSPCAFAHARACVYPCTCAHLGPFTLPPVYLPPPSRALDPLYTLSLYFWFNQVHLHPPSPSLPLSLSLSLSLPVSHPHISATSLFRRDASFSSIANISYFTFASLLLLLLLPPISPSPLSLSLSLSLSLARSLARSRNANVGV